MIDSREILTTPTKQNGRSKRPLSLINKSYQSITPFAMKMPSKHREDHQSQHQKRPFTE